MSPGSIPFCPQDSLHNWLGLQTIRRALPASLSHSFLCVRIGLTSKNDSDHKAPGDTEEDLLALLICRKRKALDSGLEERLRGPGGD